MNRVGVFQKVSLEQFEKDCNGLPEAVRNAWSRILLPERAMAGSAGYDFRVPYDIYLEPGKSLTFPTGIRAVIDEGWCLQCFPRSGLGFRYKLRLANTVGIIDSDYYFSENEGHIMAKIAVEGDKSVTLKAGERFMQGIFIPYGITYTDKATEARNGGFGSTGTV